MKDKFTPSSSLHFCLRKHGRIWLIGSRLNTRGIFGSAKVTGSVHLAGLLWHALKIMWAPLSQHALERTGEELGRLWGPLWAEVERVQGSQFCGLVGSTAEKLTLVHLSSKGSPTLISRISIGSCMEKGLQEVRLLSAVSALFPQVPSIVTVGQVAGGVLMSQTAGPNRFAGHNLSRAHWDFLFKLGSIQESAEIDPWHAEVRRLDLLLPQLNGPALLVTRALSSLLRQTLSLPAVAVHGDFTPWNLRQLPDGRIFAFDWENGCTHGLPWMDAMHFEFQTNLLLRKSSWREIDHALERCLRTPYVMGGSTERLLNPDEQKSLKLLFLVGRYIDASQEERTCIGIRQKAALDVITHAANQFQ